MRALITGGAGQLGSDLQELLGEDARSFGREQLDITDRDAVARAVDEVQPDVIFNCAAFHNVDVCEIEAATAFAVNVEAVRALAALGPRLVHISTNYVFDGRRPEPYGEDDVPTPRSVYAITKLAGEHAALAYGAGALVVRTGGLYGLHGSVSKGGNFVERMSRRARETGALRMVADQVLQPTATADLAAAIVDAVRRGASGVVHLTAPDPCSWWEFTQAFLELQGIDATVEPGETVLGPGQPDRPLNGVLARPRADALGLPVLPTWREQLEGYLRRRDAVAT